MMRYLLQWMDQLRWQRLQPMEKLADMLVKHLPGILNYCKHKVPLGVVEAITGISKHCCAAVAAIAISTICCSKHSDWPLPRPNSLLFRKPHKMHTSSDNCGEPCFPQADKTRDDKSGYCVESSIHRADNEPSDKTTYQGR